MKPWTEFNGVRSSCETIETKFARTRFATLSADTSRVVKTTCSSPFPISTGVTLAETSHVSPIINSSFGNGRFCSRTRTRGQLEVPHNSIPLRLRQRRNLEHLCPMVFSGDQLRLVLSAGLKSSIWKCSSRATIASEVVATIASR